MKSLNVNVCGLVPWYTLRLPDERERILLCDPSYTNIQNS